MHRAFTSFALLAAGCLASSSAAQTCQSGQTLLKNDSLPAAGGGSAAVSVIQGLCEGEACGAVFDTSALGSSVRLHTAAIGYFNAGGAAGIQAQVNLKVFDGITWNAGIPTLGAEVFDHNNATGSAIGITSSGINETPSLLSHNIVVSSGTMVVVWEMEFNGLGGNCTTGFTTNFATDNTCAPPLCTCTAGTQKNLIRIQGQGWRDASTAAVLTFPLCPNFYNGNWIIRACVESIGCPTPVNLGPGTQGTGGIAPVVATSGGNPQIGNAGFGITLAAGLGGATAAMMFGTEQTNPFAGGSLYVLPFFAIPFPLGGPAGTPGAGFGTFPLPIPNDPQFVGAPLPVQGVVVDPAAQNSLALTNGLRVILCQ